MSLTTRTTTNHGPILEFLSGAIAVLGTGCFLYFTSVFVALHEFKEKTIGFMSLPFPGSAYNSEVAILTLTFICGPLLLLHLLAHLFQHRSRLAHRNAPHFPYAVAKLPVVPPEYPWMRVGLFVVLLAWPSFVYCFTCGRVFDHYGLIDNNFLPNPIPLPEEGDNEGIEKQLDEVYAKALSGAALLMRHPETVGNAKYRWNSPSWRWINLKRKDELRPKPGDPRNTTRVVTTQGIPIYQPWGFLVMSALFAISTLWLTIAGLRYTPPPPPVNEPYEP